VHLLQDRPDLTTAQYSAPALVDSPQQYIRALKHPTGWTDQYIANNNNNNNNQAFYSQTS
jgi:hypothetical protein